MRENNLMALAILGIIIGASGLGFGAYSTMQVQTGAVAGDDGDDGDDGITTIVDDTKNVYPCSSEIEIKDALEAIGTGYGTIIIIENIVLSETIEINGGGSYIIEGADLTIDCGGDRTAFNVTNAKYCTLQNFIIEASDLFSNDKIILYINEVSNNFVYIENIKFKGDADDKGLGIKLLSDNIWVIDCDFDHIRTGIVQESCFNANIYSNVFFETGIISLNQGHSSYICDNKFFEGGGIELFESSNNLIKGNIVNNSDTGISILKCSNNIISENTLLNLEYGISLGETLYPDRGGNYTIISNNIIFNIHYFGIPLFRNCDNNTISGNLVNDIISDSPTISAGIWVYGGSDSNIIIGNDCFNSDNSVGTGYGILIYGVGAFGPNYYNEVLGNTCAGNEVNLQDNGIGTVVSGNNAP